MLWREGLFIVIMMMPPSRHVVMTAASSCVVSAVVAVCASRWSPRASRRQLRMLLMRRRVRVVVAREPRSMSGSARAIVLHFHGFVQLKRGGLGRLFSVCTVLLVRGLF